MTNTVQIAANATVKVGRKTFSISDAVQHVVAVYDALWLLQSQQLDHYREIGNVLLGLKALFAEDRQAFGKFIATTDLAVMSKQDRHDAMFIAENWTKVQALNKNGKLDSLGVSAIRKRVKAAEGGAGKRKSEQKVAKGKAEVGSSDLAAEPKVQTEEELADLVLQLVADNGLDFTKFAKALAAKRKGS